VCSHCYSRSTVFRIICNQHLIPLNGSTCPTQKTLSPFTFTISADKRYLLLAQNVVKLFRHSYLAQYTLYDIQTRWVLASFRSRPHFSIATLIPDSESIKLRHSPHQDEWPYLHYARFTPAGNALVWVQSYDIYYREEVRSASVHRITHDAVPGVVYNGIPDWLYEGKWHLRGYIACVDEDLFVEIIRKNQRRITWMRAQSKSYLLFNLLKLLILAAYNLSFIIYMFLA